MAVREVKLVPYFEADQMLKAQEGWSVAPEEDNNTWIGMVYLQRFPVTKQFNLGLTGWWGLPLPRLFGRKVVTEDTERGTALGVRFTAYWWRGEIYVAKVEKLE